MIRQYWKVAGVSLIAGIVGVLLTWGVGHLYQDHQNLHAALNWIVAVQQAQQKAVPQVPPGK